MTKKTSLAVALVVLAFVALLAYSTMGLRQYRVEVCMNFGGRTECKTASGATRDEALRTAVNNACTLIASGMTDSMACERTTPSQVRWLAQP